MNTIEKEQLEKLLHIIQPSPLLTIAHFCDYAEVVSSVLSDFCNDREYEYLLNCTDEAFYKQALQIHSRAKWIKIKDFNLLKPSYMTHGKFYDYLFVTSVIADDIKEQFIQKSHRVIKNAGHIVIFVQKDSYSEAHTWIELLEKNNFVATSTIDMFKNHNVIISKKMHGWGG